MSVHTQIKSKTLPSRNVMPLAKATLLAMGAATAANVILYYGAGALFPEVPSWPGAGVPQIIGATVIYLLVGAITYGILRRLARAPRRVFGIAATLVMIGSLWLPISAALGLNLPPGVPAASISTAVVLGLMHIVSYAIVLPIFTKLTQTS